MGDSSAGQPHVIALVASAGGLEAVTSVLSELPTDLGAAVVVLVHQEPERASRLPEILNDRTSLAVAAAEHDDELIAGTVLVVPPGRHLLIGADDRVVLIRSGAFPPSRPSADLLLATLAVSLRDRAIAVILSGGGNDGATGATAVHDLGGIVLTADEPSSLAFSMPESAIERDSIVTGVHHVDEIATRLVELTRS